MLDFSEHWLGVRIGLAREIISELIRKACGFRHSKARQHGDGRELILVKGSTCERAPCRMHQCIICTCIRIWHPGVGLLGIAARDGNIKSTIESHK